MFTTNTNIRDVNAIHNHVQCKEKKFTFAIEIPTMNRHVKRKTQAMHKVPCVSKACASKVRVGNGFVTQVLECGIA